MKSFTTDQYIMPIVSDILENYNPVFLHADCYNSVCIMNKKNSNLGFFLKENEDYFHGYKDYFPISGKVKNLLDSLSKYCQCVETYENELLWYQSNETTEINKAINNKLIAAITGGKQNHENN